MQKLVLIKKGFKSHGSLKMLLGDRFLSPADAAHRMVNRIARGKEVRPSNADDFVGVCILEDERILHALRDLARRSGTSLKELEVHCC